MSDKPATVEELQAQLATANSTIADLNTKCVDLETENDGLAGKVAQLTTEVTTLRKGLNLSRTENMDPAIRKMIDDKMRDGLSPQQAIECAFRQAAHDERLAKAGGKESKPAAATRSNQPPRR